MFNGAIAGAISGAIIGLLVGIAYMLFAKSKPCPQCGAALPKAWIVPPRQCSKCGCRLGKNGLRK
jgi:hypothetical protein